MSEVKLTREAEPMHAGGSVAYRVTVAGRWIGWVGDAKPWRGHRYGQRYWWACWREEGDTAARWNSDEPLGTRKAAIQALLSKMEERKGSKVDIDDVVNEAEKYSLMLWDSGTEFDDSENTRRIIFAKRDDADVFVSWLEGNGIQLRDEDRPDVWTVWVRLSRPSAALWPDRDDLTEVPTRRIRSELDYVQDRLENKRRYNLRELDVAQFSRRRVRLEQVLAERAGEESD